MSRRALLVGINEFQRLKDGREVPPLAGCVRDAEVFAELLSKFLFPNAQTFEVEREAASREVIQGLGWEQERDQILVLKNRAATRQGILDGLDWLLSDFDGGRHVRLFQISSHGSFVADLDGDEEDGQDEVLVPYDHDWDIPLRDDDLRQRFDTIPEGVNFTFIADCCHSGSAEALVVGGGRYAPPPTTRFLEPPFEVRFGGGSPTRNPELGKEGGQASGSAKEKGQYGLRTTDRHVLLAASRDFETAAERKFSGVTRGVFSRALEHAIREEKGRLSYRRLAERATELLEKESQMVQLALPSGWETKHFLEPVSTRSTNDADNRKEQDMESNMVKFLATLKDRSKWKKAAKEAGLSDKEMKLLKEGKEGDIESHLAALFEGDDTPKPGVQQG